MKEPHGSWQVWVTFCVVTTLSAALGFGILFAGSFIVFAVAQLPQVSHDSVSADEQARAVASQAAQLSPVTLSPVTVAGESDAASGRTFAGMITDSRCGARHSMNSGKTSAECARSCVRNGSRYLLVNGEVIHSLEGDPTQLDKLAGERVEVVGLLEGDTIKVKVVAAR
jgi:hypothetical protein